VATKRIEVMIGSRTNERRIMDVPIVARYVIEARGFATAEKKAIKLAAEDGIVNPVIRGAIRLDLKVPEHISTDLFYGALGVDSGEV